MMVALSGRYTLIAWLLAAIGLAGCDSAAPANAPSEQRGFRGVVLEEPLAKPDFVLTDTNGEPFDFREETDGYLTLLFIGFTHCPDVCPVQVANIAATLRHLPRVEARTRLIFITADPDRDTPERLREWLSAFNHRFVGLRGTREEVQLVERALNLPPSYIPPDAEGNYEVGHAAQVIAFSPDGPARVIFPFGTRQIDYAHDLPRLLRDPWGDS